jgi:hypothetical protein
VPVAQGAKRSLLQVAQRRNVAAHRHAYLDLAHVRLASLFEVRIYAAALHHGNEFV